MLRSNEKYKASYVLNEYAYFGQEVNFYKVLQVQPLDTHEDELPSMEESNKITQDVKWFLS